MASSLVPLYESLKIRSTQPLADESAFIVTYPDSTGTSRVAALVSVDQTPGEERSLFLAARDMTLDTADDAAKLVCVCHP